MNKLDLDFKQDRLYYLFLKRRVYTTPMYSGGFCIPDKVLIQGLYDNE